MYQTLARKTIVTRSIRPVPRKRMNSGINAAVEVTTNMLTHGRKIASATAERPMTAPSGMPTTQAAMKPIAICRSDEEARAACRLAAAGRHIDRTADGGANRPDRRCGPRSPRRGEARRSREPARRSRCSAASCGLTCQCSTRRSSSDADWAISPSTQIRRTTDSTVALSKFCVAAS
jgi:hypothetical protein